MGLLDDAIREHLELKRLRGADPGEVAREQHEALDPVPDPRDASDGDAVAVDEVEPGDVAGSAPVAGATRDADPASSSNPEESADLSEVVQETAELDMRTVMDEHAGDAVVDAAGEGTLDAGSAAGHAEEDSLEWEVPDARSESTLEETPDR